MHRRDVRSVSSLACAVVPQVQVGSDTATAGKGIGDAAVATAPEVQVQAIEDIVERIKLDNQVNGPLKARVGPARFRRRGNWYVSAADDDDDNDDGMSAVLSLCLVHRVLSCVLLITSVLSLSLCCQVGPSHIAIPIDSKAARCHQRAVPRSTARRATARPLRSSCSEARCRRVHLVVRLLCVNMDVDAVCCGVTPTPTTPSPPSWERDRSQHLRIQGQDSRHTSLESEQGRGRERGEREGERERERGREGERERGRQHTPTRTGVSLHKLLDFFPRRLEQEHGTRGR
jgi:hypothetical protein